MLKLDSEVYDPCIWLSEFPKQSKKDERLLQKPIGEITQQCWSWFSTPVMNEARKDL